MSANACWLISEVHDDDVPKGTVARLTIHDAPLEVAQDFMVMLRKNQTTTRPLLCHRYPCDQCHGFEYLGPTLVLPVEQPFEAERPQ